MAAAEYGGVPETGRERQLSTALIRADGLRRLDSFLGHRSARPVRPLRVQAVWKRFSHPNNRKQPGVIELEATG